MTSYLVIYVLGYLVAVGLILRVTATPPGWPERIADILVALVLALIWPYLALSALLTVAKMTWLRFRA